MKFNLGQIGENKALLYLKKKGYVCVEKNFRCKLGEIDLIMLDGKTLVIVEVKSGTQKNYPAYGHFNRAKKKKVLHLAQIFLLKHPQFSNHGVRFDLVTYERFGQDEMMHYQNVIENVDAL